MLRITTSDQPENITLKLESKLAGLWVLELSHLLANVYSENPDRSFVIDLTSITFIDNAGRALLTTMAQRGARLVAADCLTRAIVAEIQSELSSAG